ncbi:hypothetical protein ACLMAJ_29165 [Nocardia sp. KC 131]|uniref:hypothetical protein n=1 Tax=Nocardia arseniciresistens TaxID=3392119 RepID=UPI00398E4851
MTTSAIADDEMRRKPAAPQSFSARRTASATGQAVRKRITVGHLCCQHHDGEPELNYLTARAILADEHTLPCDRWLAAAAYMSADLDDD